MRQAVVIVLALAILAVGVGIMVYSFGWLAPATAASQATFSSDTNADSVTNSVAVPSLEQAGATESVLGSDIEGEMTTYSSQGQDGLCDHDKSASTAGY